MQSCNRIIIWCQWKYDIETAKCYTVLYIHFCRSLLCSPWNSRAIAWCIASYALWWQLSLVINRALMAQTKSGQLINALLLLLLFAGPRGHRRLLLLSAKLLWNYFRVVKDKHLSESHWIRQMNDSVLSPLEDKEASEYCCDLNLLWSTVPKQNFWLARWRHRCPVSWTPVVVSSTRSVARCRRS